jgi:hypothetical protein
VLTPAVNAVGRGVLDSLVLYVLEGRYGAKLDKDRKNETNNDHHNSVVSDSGNRGSR